MNFDNEIKKYEKEKEELKKELLVNILEKCGYEGIDNSVEISLYDYCLVSLNGDFIAHFEGRYELFSMSMEDVKDIIEDRENNYGLFSYTDTSKEDYLRLCEDEENLHRIVSDIYGYDMTLLINDYFTYPLTINDLIDSLIDTYGDKKTKSVGL